MEPLVYVTWPRWQAGYRCYDDNRWTKFYYPGGAPPEEVALAQVVVGRWGRSTRLGLRVPLDRHC